MKNMKNTEKRKEVDRGTLTLDERRKFTAAALLSFAGGEASAASGGAETRGAERVREDGRESKKC